MGITRKEQHYILKEFLREISHISDKEYQRRVWIRGEGPDFDEAVCRYSESADFILSESMAYGISEIQLQILLDFHLNYKSFWDENDLPQLFIDTPEWTKITFLAKEVLKAFDSTKSLLESVMCFMKGHLETKLVSKLKWLEELLRRYDIPILKRLGTEYSHPTQQRTSVRVMPGKPYSPCPRQQNPYIVHIKNGMTLDKFGKVVPSDSLEALIPSDEFVYRD